MKKKRKSQIIASVIALLSVILIAAVVIIVLGRKEIQQREQQIQELSAELAANTRTVYVAILDINAGEKIEENVNVVSQDIKSGLSSDIYITSEELGGKAVVDIPNGSAVEKNMVTDVEITTDTRDYEIAVANLMVNQENHDIVDIRIWFPDGSDYIVLSKKEIYNLAMGSSTFDSLLNEEEILRLQSATVDGLLNGGKIYTTRYVEPTLQEAATEFYPVNEAVLALIQSGDPNILTRATETLNMSARMDLEARLNNLSPDAVEAIANQTGAGQILTSEDYQPTTSSDSTYDYFSDTIVDDVNTSDAEDILKDEEETVTTDDTTSRLDKVEEAETITETATETAPAATDTVADPGAGN